MRRISPLLGLMAASFAMPLVATNFALARNEGWSVHGGTSFRGIRSRGPTQKRKKKPNRLHISKRVRRKHRRAA